jgi:hypothetical protein
MVEPFTRVMRWRLVECLVETASPPEVVIQMVEQGQFRYEEIAQRFWDWLEFVPTLESCGALNAETLLAVGKVNDTFLALDRTDSPWTAEAMRQSPAWDAVRRAAQEALDAFARMGLPAPSLTDVDFNKPRSDAP